MSEIQLAPGRRLLVCDVCLTYVDEHAPVTATWQQAPENLGGPDRCPDCAVPVPEGRRWWDEFSPQHAEAFGRAGEPENVLTGRGMPSGPVAADPS